MVLINLQETTVACFLIKKTATWRNVEIANDIHVSITISKYFDFTGTKPPLNFRFDWN